MAFWPPSDPVGLPGTWIQVMKRMPNTMKCHEMPWCYGKRPTISFLVLTWLTCVFWPWKVLSLCPLFLDFPMCFPGGAVNTSLDLPTTSPAPRPTWWLWTTHWLPKPCRGTGTRGGSRTENMVSRSISSRLSLWRRIMFHKADLYLWSMKLGRPGLGCYEWARSTQLDMTYRIGCFFHGPTPGKSRWALLHRNWKRSDTTWGLFVSVASMGFLHRKTVGWAEPRLLISSYGGCYLSLTELSFLIWRTVVFKQFSKNSVGWWFGGLNRGWC